MQFIFRQYLARLNVDPQCPEAVSHFGNYSKTYGALAGVVILLLWLFLTAYVILLGAEINSESEAQTAKDTTEGPALPMGDRNAVKADTVAV